MTHKLLQISLIACCMCVLGLASHSSARAQLPINISYNWRPPFPVPEFVDNTIPFWGYATIEPSGKYYIRYNLINIQQWKATQEMMVFTRVHEHGHIVTKSSDEGVVDCWASKELARTDPKILAAAITWLDTVMANQGGGVGKGNGHQRAAWMRQCSKGIEIIEGGGDGKDIWGEKPWRAMLKSFIAESHSGFNSLKGKKIDSETWMSTWKLPAAVYCRISDLKDNNCLMGRFTSYSEAESIFNKVESILKRTLPEGWSVVERPSKNKSFLKTLHASKDNEDTRISAYLVQKGIGDYHVDLQIDGQ